MKPRARCSLSEKKPLFRFEATIHLVLVTLLRIVTFVPELLYLFRTNPLLILVAFTSLRFSHLITSRDGEGLQGLRSPQKTEEARSTIVRYRLGSVLMGRL